MDEHAVDKSCLACRFHVANASFATEGRSSPAARDEEKREKSVMGYSFLTKETI